MVKLHIKEQDFLLKIFRKSLKGLHARQCYTKCADLALCHTVGQ